MALLSTFTDKVGNTAGSILNAATFNPLVNAINSILDATGNLVVPSGGKLKVAGQTNPPGSSTVSNQGVGGIGVPSGTLSGAILHVTNTLCTPNSYVLATPRCGVGANWWCYTANVSNGGFDVIISTKNGNPTDALGDVIYLIIN